MSALHYVKYSIQSIQPRARGALLCGLAIAACWTEDEIGTPLSIELAGPDAGRVGEELSVRYDVTGRQLVGVIFEWGDGVADSVRARGAQAASGSVRHTYEAAGTFTVTGRAEDVVDGLAEARVEIDIVP